MKTAHLLLLLASSIVIISCNSTDFSNPEDVIKNYGSLSLENENGVLYDDFLSTKSKEFVTKDEFIKTRDLPDSILDQTKHLDTKITSFPVDVNNPSFRRFKVDEKSLTKIDTIYSRQYYTLINENGIWKVVWTGSLLAFSREKFDRGNYSEARKTLEKIIEVDPFNGSAYNVLAGCYMRDNSLSRNERENGIVTNVKYALALEEDNPKHYNTLAAYYAGNNFSLAIQTCERGLKYCQNRTDKTQILSNLSIIYMNNFNYEKAEEYIKRSIATDDKGTHTWFTYGLLMQTQGNYKDAVLYYDQALNLSKMEDYLQSDLYYSYAYCCNRLKMCEKAKEYITKALDINPDNNDYQSLFNRIKNCK